MYFQIFTKFIPLYQKELLDFGIKLPKIKYPEIEIDTHKPDKIVTKQTRNFDLNQMNEIQVKKLFELTIVDNKENPSFIRPQNEHSSYTLYLVLKNQGTVNKKYSNVKYSLNCENIYMGFIFYWLVRNNYIASYVTIKNEGVFFTKRNFKITQQTISSALYRLDAVCPKYESIAGKKVREPKQLRQLLPHANAEQIVNYLHESLSYITSPSAAKS